MNMNEKPPLLMPPGSIRGLIALGLVTSVVGLAIMGKEDQTLTGLTGMVLGYYFKSRDSEPRPGA